MSLAEIARDPALRVYGAVLGLTWVLTAASWRGDRDLVRLLSAGQPAICWPVFEGCADVRVLPASVWAAVPWGVAALGLVVTGLFASGRVRWAVGALAALTLLGTAITLQDYRLRLNQHLMHTIVLAVFLLVPRKRDALRAVILGFYVSAGLLKLDADWLTGQALGPDGLPGVPASWLPVACAAVVLLELVGVFGLLGPPSVARPTAAVLVGFHGLSWGIVGFYYPLLMLGLLSIFWLCGRVPAPLVDASRAWPLAVLVGFAGLQLVPRTLPGDPAITGQGRLFALHMFDAYVLCEASMDVRTADGRVQHVPIPTDIGPMRMRCDPIVHWGVARHTCRTPGVVDLTLHLSSRRSTQPALRPVVARDRFCTDPPSAGVWSNDWVLPVARRR